MKDHPKIFLIGFNKCGTTSFHDYFKANNISSIHWRANTLAMTLKNNLAENKRLLEGVDMWTAYTDIICIPGSPWGKSTSDHCELIEGSRYFKYLHHDYPDALFILNTRDPFHWVRSRMKQIMVNLPMHIRMRLTMMVLLVFDSKETLATRLVRSSFRCT